MMSRTRTHLALAAASLLLTAAAGCLLDATEGGDEDIDQLKTSTMSTELAFPGQTGTLREGVLLLDADWTPRVGFEDIEGSWVFEGDIILDRGLVVPDDEGEETEIGQQSGGLAGTGYANRLWPNGVVPYVISGLPNTKRVTDAIAQFHSKTGIKWVKRSSQKDYVVFKRETGCWSYVGKVGGAQTIGLADACSTGNTIHEMLHAIGAWHEQSRADRDKYVKILFGNIQSGRESAFKTYTEQGYKGRDIGGYDFASIMHYDSYAFSKNGKPTIVRKSDGKPFKSQRSGLSSTDVAGIKTLYSSAPPPKPTCTPKTVAGAEKEPFKDMPPGSLGHDEAILLAEAGITGGCKADPPLFCPKCDLTRAQMVTFLVRAAKLPLVNPSKPTFSDVPRSSSAYKYVETAAKHGITQGCSSGKFCPTNPVTRGQMAAFIRRARGWPKASPASPSFSDVPKSHTFYGDVEALKKNCVTEGCGGGKYCVSQSITRAQAAVFVARAFDLGGSNPCSGGGTTSCKPKTCDTLGAQCGKIGDGCGNELSCGSCPLLQTCSANKCTDSSTSCEPKTCESLGAECGSVDDGCGNQLSCGICPLLQTCSANNECTPL